MSQPITLDRISPRNVAVFREIRLRALQDSPTAFASTYADESQFTDEVWLRRAIWCTTDRSVGFLALAGTTGCGIVRGSLDDDDPQIGWVESMWVAPSNRRRGVGQLLVNAVIDWARDCGIGMLKLDVTKTNEAAIRFYKSLNFRDTGQTKPYAQDSKLVECEMCRPVQKSAE
jgi:ribosomal protein S18 acetylase RimI-like enzyme